MKNKLNPGKCANCASCPLAGKCLVKSSPVDPRESMRRLWQPLQWIITELTGKALSGQKPPFLWSAGGRLMFSVIVLLLGMGFSLLALRTGGLGWGLLLPGWLLTVSAMRTWQTTFVHHAAHGNFLQPAAFGSFIAELLSTLAWIQPLSGYKPEHVLHHAKTATLEDADLRFLVALGFQPGQTRRQYWKQFWLMVVSPVFHAKYASFRLNSNFITAPPLRRAASLVVALLTISALLVLPLPMMLLWIIPAWPLYHAAGLVQLLTEHNWVRIGDGRDKPRTVISRLTNARFFGEIFPDEAAPGKTKVIWWIRLILVYLPQRLFVAQGDLPNHDWHHREPKGNWANAAYSRRDSVKDLSWSEYTELWSICSALDQTFRLLGALPSDAQLGEPLSYGEMKSAMLGM